MKDPINDDDFLKKIKVCGKYIDDGESLVENMRKKEYAMMRIMNVEKQKKGMEEIGELTSSLLEKTQIIKEIIEELDKSEKHMSKDEEKIAQLQNQMIKSRFSKLITRFRKVQLSIKNAENERIARQYQIAFPYATEEDIDNLETEDAQKVFQKAFSTSSNSSSKILTEAERRHKNMQEITEKTITISELTKQLNLMVKSDRIKIESIEENTIYTTERTNAANRELHTALTYRRKANHFKRTVIAIILFAFFVLIIIIIIIIKK